ncbi:MAG: GGDEF domain-containing protein [Nitrospirae bacterium]|nr:GGDEF domain-containing protein [Nitrospirota bacterium]
MIERQRDGKTGFTAKHGVTFISVGIGLLMWFMDAACSSKGSFMDAFILDVPGYDLFFRILLLATFIFSGMFMSRMLSRREDMQDQLAHSKKEWEETFDVISDAVTIHDRDFNIIRVNKAAKEMLGMPSSLIMHRKCYRSFHGSDVAPESCPACKTLATGMPSVTEIFEPRVNRHLEIKILPRFDHSNQLAGIVHIVRDISERFRTDGPVRSLSLTDDLTGLYNRRGFMTMCEQQQKSAVRMKRGFVMLFADVDGLNVINDSFGHSEGCHALIRTSAILRESFRETDIVARVGGDEFAVFSAGYGTESEANAVVGRLQKRIAEHNERGECRYRLSVSTGMAYCAPETRREITDMLNEADRVMYAEKETRKSSCGRREGVEAALHIPDQGMTNI